MYQSTQERECTRRSDMNETLEALFNSALASTDKPSGVRTDMRQVMSNAFDLSFMALLEDMLVVSLSSVDPRVLEPACGSMCRRV